MSRGVRPRIAADDPTLGCATLAASELDGVAPRLPTFAASMTVNRIERVELGEGSLQDLQARAELWLKRHYVLEGGAVAAVTIEAVPEGGASLVPTHRTQCSPRDLGRVTICTICGIRWASDEPPPPCGAGS